MRHVILTNKEVEKLTFIKKNGKHQLERNRSMCLLLSGQGRSMSEVAKLMNINRMTVVRLLNAWDSAAADNRFTVLYREEGQYPKIKLEAVKDKLPSLLEEKNRNVNLVLEELEKSYNIKVCKATLLTFLKDTGL